MGTPSLRFFDPDSSKSINFDAIDFRVEDWGSFAGMTMAPSPHVKRALIQSSASFSAPLPGGQGYLNVSVPGSNRYAQAEASGALNPSTAAPQIWISYEPEFEEVSLPNFWYKFAAFYQGNDLVKAPLVMRDSDQAILDRMRREKPHNTPFKLVGGEDEV